jgi:hypothetical protein
MPRNPKEIAAFLEERARAAAPIFYNELAKEFALPPVAEYWTAHPLSEIFGRLDHEDHENHRPFRTALVIAKETSIPGIGFFKTLQELRGMRIPKDELKRMVLWKQEFDRLVEFYKSK